MAAVLTLRVYSGTDAATESAAETAIAWTDVDDATVDPTSDTVAPGTNSYEKWMRVSIDTPDGGTFTNFWIERSGDLPDGVVVKMGVTDTAATPTRSASTVATTTMADGRRYIFDANEYSTSGDKSRYVVVQEQTTAAATTGDIDQQTLTFGWQQSS